VLRQLRPALVALACLSLLTGVVYPLLVTGVAQVVFPRQANGNLIRNNEELVGSSLIGQSFEDPRYFWGRISTTSPVPYAPFAFDGKKYVGSTGSNYGPLNPSLINPDIPADKLKPGRKPELTEDEINSLGIVQRRIYDLLMADPENEAPIPVDLITSSASGLDPHISPAAAEYQVARVARERKRSPDEIRQLVAKHTEGRTLGLLGEPRVNVLELNLALDGLGK
jgi:K+-transporting ATPase ATPase C chain